MVLFRSSVKPASAGEILGCIGDSDYHVAENIYWDPDFKIAISSLLDWDDEALPSSLLEVTGFSEDLDKLIIETKKYEYSDEEVRTIKFLASDEFMNKLTEFCKNNDIEFIEETYY